MRVEQARLGPSGSLESGISGTEYYDAFESRWQTYIGPVGGGGVPGGRLADRLRGVVAEMGLRRPVAGRTETTLAAQVQSPTSNTRRTEAVELPRSARAVM